MFNYLNKTDSDVKRDVANELLWDPSVTSSEIKLSVHDGAITLSGSVPTVDNKLTIAQ